MSEEFLNRYVEQCLDNTAIVLCWGILFVLLGAGVIYLGKFIICRWVIHKHS